MAQLLVSQDLSFEQAPPISVPLRFFLSAPWFGVAAGLLLAWQGETATLSRWTPEALALTHLMAVGLMLQAMTGALFQFVPVAAGCNVWRPRLVANLLHPALLLAALSLAIGFLTGSADLLRISAPVFVLAVGLQIAVFGHAVFRTTARGATIRALRLAIVGLGVTLILGATLIEGLGGRHAWALVAITNVHAAWALGGWALMLLTGVCYFVVPMFQLTPAYPDQFARLLPYALLAVLCLWSLQLVMSVPVMDEAILLTGFGLAGLFGAVTLWLQQRRRRRVADTVFWFFRVAMICLLASLISVVAMLVVPTIGGHPRAAWWLGILIFAGTFMSAINGMLYKIVPFICWLHLQRLAGLGTAPPNVRDILPTGPVRGQMALHFLSIGLLLSSVIWPILTPLAGTTLAGSSAWLGWNLFGAARAYAAFRDRIRASAGYRAP